MRSILCLAALASSAFAAPASIRPRNFIFVVPDGLAPASETFARVYQAYLNGSTAEEPEINALPVDALPLGNVRTHSYDNLVTDSAAAGTAFASGQKTLNGAIGVNPQNETLGTVLEAAKMAGLMTGLVVTSTINHATPASFSAHVINRNNLAAIAEQQIGYSHPLNQSVDVLMGGGACFFKPQSDNSSCRTDDIDLLAYASEQGYYVAETREGFNALEGGLGETELPILGLFTQTGQMAYDVDRLQQPEEEREPSLSEMTEVALNTLHRATGCSNGQNCEEPGYFLLIESARIDHSSHAHDGVAHLYDVLEYHRTVEAITAWIDEHPDTVMISVADHETGGLTLPSGWDASPITNATHSVEYIYDLYSEYDGDDNATYLAELLPMYGLPDANETEIESLVEAEDFSQALADMLNDRTGLNWGTGGHTSVDTTLYAYAAGDLYDRFRLDLAGGHDNTDLPKYVASALGLDIDEVTAQLRALGTEWIP